MADNKCDYLIIGGGLAGASAIEGIREHDKDGSILLLASEKHMPYDRPPLSKKLWFGKKKVEEIFLHDTDFYADNGVEVLVGRQAMALDPKNRSVTDSENATHRYKKLLLATGGTPRTLDIPGADLQEICYYRNIDDYLRMRQEAGENKSALIIGGGFIGSEMAAALRLNNLHVTMLFPEDYPVARIFPAGLGQAIGAHYKSQGIKLITGALPASIKKDGSRFLVATDKGESVEADIVIIGAGIIPNVEVAGRAGLDTDNGVIVNQHLQTSHPDIYAAGDIAFFPYQALDKSVRIEHWDNALNQGKHAGRNMAGADEPFVYMPYFFSDLFDFGYEAVGEIDSRLETFADWQKENDTGVIYYLKEVRLRGAMMCNVWDKVEDARKLIRSNKTVTPEDLKGAIK